MALPIWPTSPVPASLSRKPTWNANVNQFDSGLRQGSSPYVKPLMQFSVRLSNVQRSKQSSLWAFFNSVQGQTSPFLFSDPYDNRVNGGLAVRTGTAATSFFLRTSEGYPIIPVSGTLLITSNLSGAMTQGTHYQFNADTGVFSAMIAIRSNDYWTGSASFYKKCAFDSYEEDSDLWENFQITASFSEIALP